ncbi:MAG: hypothetical protein CSB06_02875 [Bacteroidia bacterium]|nr:MAG: hypothetical protein CSB06_02875 [Bacteroidia bacterium]
MKKIIISLFLLSATLLARAQQDPMFTHYAFNTLAVNPAYAGTRDALTVTGLYRSQWVGFPGAPITQTLTLHSPIVKKSMGLGLSVLNDKIGPTKTTSFYLDFAYRIRITEKSWLSFGLKGGLNARRNELTSLNTTEENDPLFAQNVKSKLLPNLGLGIYYFADKYYFGLSTPKLFENNFTGNTTDAVLESGKEQRHFFFIAGAVFQLSEDILLKPTGFVKYTQASPVEADITANFIFHDRFWVGAMYRTGDALGILAGVNITKQLALGYSFDWSFVNPTATYNAGSHEVMLRYDFLFKGQEKVLSPRYF